MELTVGRIGRAHGVRGEVRVAVRTDDPDARFAVGAVLRTDPVERGPLTVVGSRPVAGGLVVAFHGVTGREGAEALRGTVLLVDSAALPALADPEEFYDHQLVGLAAQLPGGGSIGVVQDVLHSPGGELLLVRGDSGREHLVPFVRAFVPVVDLAGGRVVVDPPEGLLEL